MNKKEISTFAELAKMSDARLGLDRAGSSLATEEILKFDLDHARARDAVHLPFDTEKTINALDNKGWSHIQVQSAAINRGQYLQRPDLGRRLNESSQKKLKKIKADSNKKIELSLIIADGLSSTAIHTNALPFLEHFTPLIQKNNWTCSPIVIASQARVALADHIGELLESKISVILIGERPGLTAADSMGLYLTYEPQRGKTDADKNCISNVRQAGLSPLNAALKLEHLIQKALHLRLSGVNLKDDESLIIESNNDIP